MVKADSNYSVYDNDTIRVVYSFWAEKGIMSFMIINKLEVPIYIDWKKSSYISKDEKNDYYAEKEFKTATIKYNSTGSTINWGSIFKNPIVSNTAINSGTSLVSETLVKEERITFLPPHSYIFKGSYQIVHDRKGITLIKENTRDTVMDSKKAKVTSVNTNALIFRNFLTYSITDKFEKEYYVDNAFCINKVVTIKDKYFSYVVTTGNKRELVYPYFNPNRFYLRDLDKSSNY